MGFPGGAAVKNPPANAGDTGDVGSILGLGRSPGAGNGNPLQDSCLENPMDRGAWGAIQSVGSQKRWTQLRDWELTCAQEALEISKEMIICTKFNQT